MPSVLGTWERCLELFSSCIAPDVLVQIPHYITSMRTLHLAMGQHPQTLVHGDVRLDNVMMGTSVDQHPVVLIDWQAVMVSNAMHDLAYLLSQSLTIETRRAHEDELVRHYHSRMVDLGVTDFTIEQCWAGYDVGVLFLFSYPLIIGGAFDPDNERGKQLAEEILRRSSQTVSDRQLFAMLP
jgi:thiamine kinase-like enzyme